MATITLKINENTREGKTLLDLIQLFSEKKSAVEIINNKYHFLEESIEEYKTNKIIEGKDAKDLIKKLKS